MNDGTKQYLETISWLGKLYNYVNDNLFNGELKRPVITVQTDESNKAFGWFTLKRVWHVADVQVDWYNTPKEFQDESEFEINMSAQCLNRSVNEIAGTMIHEMCHQYAQVHNVQDCSRSGTYHNKLFKKIAEDHGLSVEKIDKSGWARTALTAETIELLGYFFEKLPATLIYRNVPQKGIRVKSSSTRKYVCPCCGMSVRATRSVNIMCADCNEYMRVE